MVEAYRLIGYENRKMKDEEFEDGKGFGQFIPLL
ncbi:YfbK domain-containing protein [Proteiniphilum sp.]